jgi:hypothetical protein
MSSVRSFICLLHFPSELFTTQYANQILQGLLVQIVTFPHNPQKIFVMYININMALVSSMSELCSVHCFPAPWHIHLFQRLLRRTFLQMLPSDLCEIWNPHDIPAVFAAQACLMMCADSSICLGFFLTGQV